MCIRDRSISITSWPFVTFKIVNEFALSESLYTRNTSKFVFRESLCTRKKLGSTHPVSYTHLRAHETRGNLVCRLLLEKKNCQFCFEHYFYNNKTNK